MQLEEGDGNGDTRAGAAAMRLEANEEVLNDNSTDDELEATETFLSDQVPEADAAVGDEIVLRSSDVSEEDLEDWVKQGYSVMERTEGGEIYLRFTASEFNHKSPKDEELQVRPPLSVFVEMEEVEEDEDEDSDTVFKGQGEVIPLDWSVRQYVDSGKVIDGKTFFMLGTNQQAYAQVGFRSACDRSDMTHTILHMEMFDVIFGVLNSNNNRNHRGHFIYRLEVKASPSKEWRSKVCAVNAEPANSPTYFDHQRHTTREINVGVDVMNFTPTVGVNFGITTTIASRLQDFRWTSKVDFGRDWSVTWTWHFETWKDGQLFVPEAPGKVKWGALPKLPFDPTNFHENKIGCEAQWIVPSIELEDIAETQWDIKVQYYVVSIDQTKFPFKNGGHGFWRPKSHCLPSPEITAKITQTL